MQPQIISRSAARGRELTRYFTGAPCKHGHIAERYTRNGECLTCSANKVRRYREQYRAKCCQRLRTSYKKYRVSRLAYARSYYLRNLAKLKRQSKARATARRARNRKADNESKYAWKRANPVAARKIHSLANRKRRAAQRANGSFTRKQIDMLWSKQRGKCAGPLCQAELQLHFHIDHIIPIARGGANEIYNIQLLCRRCNQRKSAHDPIEWAQLNGLLL